MFFKEIKITTGLKFLKDVSIDTHFMDRSRFVRMAQVLASNPISIGIGIEEDTAIIVREGVKAEVIGKGVVTIIEGFSITTSNITEFSEDKPISIQDLNVHLLSNGCFTKYLKLILLTSKYIDRYIKNCRSTLTLQFVKDQCISACSDKPSAIIKE